MTIVRVKDISTLFAGVSVGRLPPAASGSEYPVISLKDVADSLPSADALPRLRVPEAIAARFRVESGDVIATARGATIRCAVAGDQHAGALAGANLIVVRLHGSLFPALAAAILRAPATHARLLAGTAGASTPGFTVSTLGELQVVVPTIERQRLLVRLVDTAEAYRTALLRAADLRRAVSVAAITFELSPPAPAHG